MRNSFSLGTFFGVELRADLSWLIAFVLVVWMLSAHYFPTGSGWTFAASLTLATATANVITELHESREVARSIAKPARAKALFHFNSQLRNYCEQFRAVVLDGRYAT